MGEPGPADRLGGGLSREGEAPLSLARRAGLRALGAAALAGSLAAFRADGTRRPGADGCGPVPGDSPLGAAQGDLEAAMRPLLLDRATGRLTPDSAAALPAWIFSPATKIVGLGEATHGTKEINEVRAAIVLEIAARTEGPLVFLIEDEFVRAAALDAYLENGTGDAAGGLKALRNIWWKNRELATLMERLRALRLTRPDLRIVFRGVDMQDIDRILARLAEVAEALGAGPAVLADLSAVVADTEAYASAATEMLKVYARRPAFDYAPIVAARSRALAALARLRAAFAAAPGPGLSARERALHIHTVRVAEQSLWKMDPLATANFLFGDDPRVKAWLDGIAAPIAAADLAPGPWDARDGAMAENAEALVALEGPGARGVFWAHNGHVSHEPRPEEKPAGAFLRSRLGEGYRAVGTEFYAGSFLSAPGDRIRTFNLKASPPSYFANAAARLCRQAGMLDLTDLSGDLSRALARPFDLHSIGGDYDPSRRPSRGVLGEQFDGLVFLRNTSAAELLPWRPPKAAGGA